MDQMKAREISIMCDKHMPENQVQVHGNDVDLLSPGPERSSLINTGILELRFHRVILHKKSKKY